MALSTSSGGVVLKKLAPAAAGAKRLTLRYGLSLVCVRYREDAAQGRRPTTVELIRRRTPLAATRRRAHRLRRGRLA